MSGTKTSSADKTDFVTLILNRMNLSSRFSFSASWSSVSYSQVVWILFLDLFIVISFLHDNSKHNMNPNKNILSFSCMIAFWGSISLDFSCRSFTSLNAYHRKAHLIRRQIRTNRYFWFRSLTLDGKDFIYSFGNSIYLNTKNQYFIYESLSSRSENLLLLYILVIFSNFQLSRQVTCPRLLLIILWHYQFIK